MEEKEYECIVLEPGFYWIKLRTNVGGSIRIQWVVREYIPEGNPVNGCQVWKAGSLFETSSLWCNWKRVVEVGPRVEVPQ